MAKKGTPTMGGLMILSGLIGLDAAVGEPLAAPMSGSCSACTLGFGAIGFYDDYLKVTKQSHAGFSSKARLALEFVIAGLAVAAVMMRHGRAPLIAVDLIVPLHQGPVDQHRLL